MANEAVPRGAPLQASAGERFWPPHARAMKIFGIA
jgi:hypothetical protein